MGSEVAAATAALCARNVLRLISSNIGNFLPQWIISTKI
jgi:hypothetical protein